ncbi:fumarylacetoacetase [Ilyonectria destructans]|nr:fumarylacetoacetase [Ilyonectria destructans]
MDSWVPTTDAFSLSCLPFGIFSTPDLDKRIGVAVGEFVLDLKALGRSHMLDALEFDKATLSDASLNRYSGLGHEVHLAVRNALQDMLRSDSVSGQLFRDNHDLRDVALVPMQDVTMHMPMDIGDYTDFYTSPYHAENATNIVRPGTKVAPSFFKMPIAYHGRSSSVVVSGTPIFRPSGHFAVDESPTFGFTQKLDFEVEFAAFIGKGNPRGQPISVDEAKDHIFGFVIMNDWSARDIQRFEQHPLGPFNAKNFATTISPWVIPPVVLEPYRTRPLQKACNHPYLEQQRQDSVFDISIDVILQAEGSEYLLAQCNTKNILFSFEQMIAHHTAGGCPMRPGDMIATGTLSGPTERELGCLLELTRDGSNPIELTSMDSKGEAIRRSWLEDRDTVKLRAHGRDAQPNCLLGFGPCDGKVVSLSGSRC